MTREAGGDKPRLYEPDKIVGKSGKIRKKP